jgi:CheY-like chemotaxis protein
MAPHKSVLVVDDCPVFRNLMRALLEKWGYTAAFAGNGREALDYLQQGDPPDVIVLDLEMPVMDGWVFRGHQRCLAALASIPVILLSADSRLPEHAFALGVASYLIKPFLGADLLAAIQSVSRHAPSDVGRP